MSLCRLIIKNDLVCQGENRGFRTNIFKNTNISLLRYFPRSCRDEFPQQSFPEWIYLLLSKLRRQSCNLVLLMSFSVYIITKLVKAWPPFLLRRSKEYSTMDIQKNLFFIHTKIPSDWVLLEKVEDWVIVTILESSGWWTILISLFPALAWGERFKKSHLQNSKMS